MTTAPTPAFSAVDLDADVLIVGAGPVGMTLAMDLASRGISVTVIEQRARRETPSVKCNHISARSMETFRRFGLADALRDTRGLPFDYPNDVAYQTTAVGGLPLARIHIPCRNDRKTDKHGPDTWWPTSEPPHRINQIDMEPVLFDHLEKMAGASIINRTRVDEVRQDEQGVTVIVTDLETGDTREMRSRYLVGCDGSRSIVRKAIGAKFEGTPSLFEVQSTFIRAPALINLIGADRAWMTAVVNPRREGVVFAIDGVEKWLIHNPLREAETFESVDRDRAIRALLGVDETFEYEIITKEDWVARRLIADRYRDRSVFICGDAAQLWVPMAGYGMNAGIASATDLAWMLAATLKGWAPERILDAYQAERHPINEQVSRFAMDHAARVMAESEATPANIEAPDADGIAARERIGKRLYDLNVQQFCCGGLNFGYYYDQSPIIAYDGEVAPPYSFYDFTPSTVPGCRVPHFELEDGRSLYDLLDADFTLIRLDPTVVVDTLLSAAGRHGVPLTVLDIERAKVPDCYRHSLLLSRPDRHVAWRGDVPPDDAENLIDLIRGAGGQLAREENV